MPPDASGSWLHCTEATTEKRRFPYVCVHAQGTTIRLRLSDLNWHMEEANHTDMMEPNNARSYKQGDRVWRQSFFQLEANGDFRPGVMCSHLGDSEHQSSSCNLHPLQFHNLTDWESTVQRVKRIQFRCDQSMNKSLKCISVQNLPDAADIVKLMESTLAHLPELLVHAHSLIKDYPNVPCWHRWWHLAPANGKWGWNLTEVGWLTTRSEDQEFRLAVIELEKVVSHSYPDIRNATLKPALRFIIRT